MYSVIGNLTGNMSSQERA